MKPSFQNLNQTLPLTFSGTGTDGKPRVVIGKADYTLDEFDAFRKRDDIEVVGVASSASELKEVLLREKPDVAILGSTFGDFSGNTPLNTVGDLLRSKTLTTIGIVMNSIFQEDEIARMQKFYADLLGRKTAEVGFEYVPGRRVNSDEMAAAVKKVDPFPVNA